MKKGNYSISRYFIMLVCGLFFAAVGATSAHATQVIYGGWNGDGVINNPTVDTVFTLTAPTNIGTIHNYHYNNGMGQDASLVGGTIGIDQIVSETESVVIGRWPATSAYFNHGAWAAYPNILLGPGTYKVVDSDPATWSYSDSNTYSHPQYFGPDWGPGKGFSQIVATAGVTATDPINTAVDVGLTQPVTITFNENIDVVAGLALDQVEIVKNIGQRSVVPTTKTLNGKTLVITPLEPYRANTPYIVSLPADSVTGSWPFVPSPAYQFVFKTGK